MKNVPSLPDVELSYYSPRDIARAHCLWRYCIAWCVAPKLPNEDEISLKTKQISELSAQVIAYDNAKVAAELAIGEAAKKQQQVITVYRDKVVTVRNEEVPKLCDKAIEFATQSSVFAW